MFTAYAIVTVVTIAVNAWAAIADFLRAGFVLGNMAELGIPRSWLPLLGGLKAAGAVGLLLGLLGVDWIGVAAAAGLILFFLGAIATHVRARVYVKTAIPGCFLILAVASLSLAVAVAR
ncbi:DoxX family protein [Nonomuraea sp. K274]|uniref:DoxX family protein n=1 Tax=Nonomuraea cypriaca TaxID=1187855 RepID=A0A931EW68_9ACTN|nr:DoxX family protein [Nonomuraea cypriaca]MBF8186394.1 DoxX family protein [Nonomuraea cypriaca]